MAASRNGGCLTNEISDWAFHCPHDVLPCDVPSSPPFFPTQSTCSGIGTPSTRASSQSLGTTGRRPSSQERSSVSAHVRGRRDAIDQDMLTHSVLRTSPLLCSRRLLLGHGDRSPPTPGKGLRPSSAGSLQHGKGSGKVRMRILHTGRRIKDRCRDRCFPRGRWFRRNEVQTQSPSDPNLVPADRQSVHLRHPLHKRIPAVSVMLFPSSTATVALASSSLADPPSLHYRCRPMNPAC